MIASRSRYDCKRLHLCAAPSAHREMTPALRPMSAYAPRRRAPRGDVRAAVDESLCAAPGAHREVTPASRPMRAYGIAPSRVPRSRPLRGR